MEVIRLMFQVCEWVSWAEHHHTLSNTALNALHQIIVWLWPRIRSSSAHRLAIGKALGAAASSAAQAEMCRVVECMEALMLCCEDDKAVELLLTEVRQP